MRDSLTDFSEQPLPRCGHDDQIAETVTSNALALQQLLDQVAQVRDVVAAHLHPAQPEPASNAVDEEEYQQLRSRIAELEDQVYDLECQNSDLASQVANQTVKQAVHTPSSDSNETLSWEDRKKLILQQMEDDSFNADQFITSMQEENQTGSETPEQFIDHLRSEIDHRDSDLARREEEIRELRHLLEQQSETRGGGVAIGAAAIAELMESDELVQQERQRLQVLQKEWEEKFRQGEIEASLERAKLSRERQELARKQAELEEQLDRQQRDARHNNADNTTPARRWMAKLGLTDDDKA